MFSFTLLRKSNANYKFDGSTSRIVRMVLMLLLLLCSTHFASNWCNHLNGMTIRCGCLLFYQLCNLKGFFCLSFLEILLSLWVFSLSLYFLFHEIVFTFHIELNEKSRYQQHLLPTAMYKRNLSNETSFRCILVRLFVTASSFQYHQYVRLLVVLCFQLISFSIKFIGSLLIICVPSILAPFSNE